MRAAALAGRFAPRAGDGEGWRGRLEQALRADGPAASLGSGPLALAWTPAGEGSGAGADGVVCLVDGRPATARLAARLGIDPVTPAERTIALGHRRLGDALLEELGGAFALLVWDPDAGRGLVARDAVGSRPLFVVERGGELLFASEVRNILALMGTRPAPDAVALAHWLTRTNARDDRTLYSGVRRLPAGHALRLDGDGWERRRHWRPRYAEPRALDGDEAAPELRAGLAAAVERSLEGAARPAVMLSGGLDSSAVAAAARALRDPAPAAYSAVFPEDASVDESARVARTREWLGLAAVEAAFVEGSPLAAGVEFLRAWELPSPTPNLFVWLPLLRRAAADGADVVLDGEGGDELFGCAPHLVADSLRALRPGAALRTARRLPGMGDDPPARRLRRALVAYGVRPALPYWLHEPLRRARGRTRLPDWLAAEAAAAQRGGDDPWAWKRIRAPRWWAHLADALTDRADALGAIDHLRREGALAGVELRHPLRDPELIELVLGLPPRLAFDPHLDRALARRALAGALPPEVLADGAKPRFNSLLARGLDARDRGALRDLLADPHPDLARRVRAGAVRALAEGAGGSGRPAALDMDLWRIAALELWLRHAADPAHTERVAERLDAEPQVDFRWLAGNNPIDGSDLNFRGTGAYP